MHIATEVDLGQRNTMALPCTASAVAKIGNISHLESALAYAAANELATVALGEGSNLLLPNRLNALVLRATNTDVDIAEAADTYVVRVAAGKPWHELVQQLLAAGIHGLENLALIPGLAGASVIQNIGAYGVEVGDYISAVHAYDTHQRRPQGFTASGCEFAYRDSLFKRNPNRYWIDNITLTLPKHAVMRCDYPALQAYLGATGVKPSPRAIFDAVVAIRSSKLPNPRKTPNCGSFFKNPVVSEDYAQTLRQGYPAIPQYRQASGVKLAAGWLIEQCGWKGKALGPVAMHTAQALVMVNNGGATLADVRALETAVRHAVAETFGVTLEREPVLLS